MVPVEDRVVVDEDFSLFDLLLLSSFSSSETSIKGVSTRLALPVCGVLTTTTLALLTMTSAEDTGLSWRVAWTEPVEPVAAPGVLDRPQSEKGKTWNFMKLCSYTI